jgi:hypothetical protein
LLKVEAVTGGLYDVDFCKCRSNLSGQASKTNWTAKEYSQVWLHQDGTPVDPSAVPWMSYSAANNWNNTQQCIVIDNVDEQIQRLNDVSCWDSKINSNHICQAPLNGNGSEGSAIQMFDEQLTVFNVI